MGALNRSDRPRTFLNSQSYAIITFCSAFMLNADDERFNEIVRKNYFFIQKFCIVFSVQTMQTDSERISLAFGLALG